MKIRGSWAGALAVGLAAILLVSCGGGAGDADQVGEQPAASQESEEQDAGEARVQVLRDRAFLGDPDAPVVIQEYSDFL